MTCFSELFIQTAILALLYLKINKENKISL